MEVSNLIEHVKNSILRAFQNNSSLPEHVLRMEGMSGRKTRHLYNNIVSLKNKTYAEVGTYKGSSFISAMYNNKDTFGICIDNWSEFNGPRDECITNINRELSNANYKIIDKDCWSITKNDLGQLIDIYLYDGPHNYKDQKNAITYYRDFFNKYVIIMVDDWTCDHVDVKRGTMDGLKEANLIVHWSYEIGLVNTNTHHRGGDTFWNGCGIFICERTDL